MRRHLAPQAIVVVRLGRVAPADVPLVIGDGREDRPGARRAAGDPETGGRRRLGFVALDRPRRRGVGLRTGHLVTALCQD
jgi:hypothetical protein